MYLKTYALFKHLVTSNNGVINKFVVELHLQFTVAVSGVPLGHVSSNYCMYLILPKVDTLITEAVENRN